MTLLIRGITPNGRSKFLVFRDPACTLYKRHKSIDQLHMLASGGLKKKGKRKTIYGEVGPPTNHGWSVHVSCPLSQEDGITTPTHTHYIHMCMCVYSRHNSRSSFRRELGHQRKRQRHRQRQRQRHRAHSFCCRWH